MATKVVNNEGIALNTYTVKILFEAYSEEVDELWLQRCDPEGMANAAVRTSKKQKALKDKNIVIADLRGKLRIERRRSRGAQLNLKKSDKIIEVLREQNDNMAGQMLTFLCSDIVNGDVIRKSHLIQHMMDQISVFSKSAYRDNAMFRNKVIKKMCTNN